MHLRAQPVARLGHQPVKTDFAFGDNRDAFAQTFGMGDDMGGKNHRHALGRLRTDKAFQLGLIQRIQARKGFIQHN